MQICTTLSELQKVLTLVKQKGQTVGFVPTMGALHEGHLSLYRRCQQECDVVVASIFVNPIQFTNAEDLQKYPRTEAQDLELLEGVGCDIAFLPSVTEMYPQASTLKISFGELESVLEGKYRPGHFSGVGVVVAKLFHMVQPDVAYFGQKDLQQFLIIQQMVDQLSFPVKLVCCDISRDHDGLALSSRNVRIPAELRNQAAFIYQSLQEVSKQMPLSHEQLLKCIAPYYAPNTDLELEYFEAVDAQTLLPVHEDNLGHPIALCVAAHLGGVRLIDNKIVQK